MPSKKTMDELAAAAAKLNRASDDLNELIEGFEDQLQRLGVGLTYWLGGDRTDVTDFLLEASQRRQGENGLFVSGWMLGYARFENKWRLVVKRVFVEVNDQEDNPVTDENEPVPLLKAPRAVRVEAAGQLEQLAEHLTRRIQHHVSAIESAKSLLKGDDHSTGEYLVEECRRLGFMGKVEVFDTRMVKSGLDDGVLYVWRAKSGQGSGADPEVAMRQSRAAIGKFFGRYQQRSAMGESLRDLLDKLGIETTETD